MINRINKDKLYEMLVHAKINLLASQEHLNALNVFPVPDGDTGSNMSLTLKHAVENIKDKSSIRSISAEFARGALMGARGNSGVIMSQIIKGLSLGLDTNVDFSVEDFIRAVHNAKERAYKAVMKPKEGTMLSIIRAMDEACEKIQTEDFVECFDILISAAEEMLEATRYMLEENKNANTVDAGAAGIVIIFKAFRDSIIGANPLEYVEADTPASKNSNAPVINPEDIKFQYCTEFIILNECNEIEFKGELEKIGDSIVVVSSDGITKVHVHTNTPGIALNKACAIGDLTKIKIDNMKEQAENNTLFTKERINMAIVAVCDGDGLENCFKEYGVTEVINGGQSMNPSVESIVETINNLNSDNVIILPNNKNIILSAKQASEIVNCNVFVVESRTIAEGIAATVSYDSSLSPEENAEAMRESLKEVHTIHITNAVKDATIDGLNIKEGDYISVVNDKVIAKHTELLTIIEESLNNDKAEDADLITVYYGSAMEYTISEITEMLQEKYDDKDIVSVYGGQVTYPLIISVE